MRKIKISMPSLLQARNRKKEETPFISFSLDDQYKGLGNNKSYHIMTYGCQGNLADSEKIAGILKLMGYSHSNDPYKSDIVVINTCAIRENAENRIWGVIGNLKAAKNLNPNMIICICGCMPQEENATEKILETYNQIDIIFGTHNIKNLPKLISDCYKTNSKVIEVLSSQGDIVEDIPIIRESKYKAWINITYGCDEFCTYCIVPYTRGKERSRKKEDIINEVSNLVKEGYIEITLLGQNVNSYGKDYYDDYSFGDLLYDLDKTGIQRIRFTTSHPRDLDLKTIEAMGKLKSVMPMLHLPVQSGSNEVLKNMNRKYTKEEYLEKIRLLKLHCPGISITTDIIVGFPNETYDQFLETIDLVKNVEFEGAFTFIYSKREGTPAARMNDNVSLEEKEKRLQELNSVVNHYYKLGNDRFQDKEVVVLVDGVSKNNKDMLCGYSEHNKLVHFKSNDMSLVGKLVNVKITEPKTWFCIGTLCE